MTNAASRLPRRVYWRRRLGVLIVLAALALLVSQVVTALDRRGAVGSATKPAGPAPGTGAGVGPNSSSSGSTRTDDSPAPSGSTANDSTANDSTANDSTTSGTTATSAPSSRVTSAGSHPTTPSDRPSSDRPSSGHSTSGHSTSGHPTSTSHTPSPSTSSSPPPPPSCTPAQLRVAAVAEQTTYSPGQQPVLFLEATNTAAAPCIQSFGARTVELTVYNGPLRVWGSNDCPSGGTSSGSSATSSGTSTASVQQLMPSGVTVKVRVVWSGTTSQPGCTQQRVPANAGNYTVYGSLAGHLGTAGQFALR